jgi:hypothetical protein
MAVGRWPSHAPSAIVIMVVMALIDLIIVSTYSVLLFLFRSRLADLLLTYPDPTAFSLWKYNVQ